MKAVIHNGKTGLQGLSFQDVPSKKPGYGEVKVKLKSAGLNHRDLFLMNNKSERDPHVILGSDGAGIIEEVGEGVKNVAVQTEVIIFPTLNWDLTENVPPVPEILGGPSDGTLAEYVIIPSQNAIKKPSYLSWEEAGVLPLSALTAYRALFTKSQLKKDEHLLIPGIGSGVATYALFMAKAIGAKVSVTSRSEEKRKKALQLGADYAFDSYSNWDEQLQGEKADVVLDSIGPALFSEYFRHVKPNGRIVSFGASSGDDLSFPVRSLFFPQINVLGTSMGSCEEFHDMLAFIEKHQLRPVLDRTYPLEKACEAYTRMQEGRQFGNIGIVME
ncbi:zinc-binding dehydrogenase [Bacillus inaquosorum]|uniref:zinc-binding dehydrogenase n=1 Tax=Bacillus inaquosorum TaxID=483913 RepID=UPI0022832C12|nr:zinc-binding dehydrogenase [Bacillus inaquosorum]MCY7975712.1 zinc-binding dehydrogenase [Bacillus inaquosorum]MCY8139699.1 zinc-binding dehydrogenase [Bacillus inaquosorum]MCY8275846.1 zinc-binding dehydrogenase [Bacillus inaquosorum]MCY8389911.1 zinc-binding dehydrogenase [Bacillus inaquosorum]MCY8728730.1 zinc-binding dehydrogenase [Bacillus inaquosorum]